MSQMIWLFFRDWPKEAIWIFGVDVLILLLIFIEDLAQFVSWVGHVRSRRRTQTLVNAALDSLEPFVITQLQDAILNNQRLTVTTGGSLEIKSGSEVELVVRNLVGGYNFPDHIKPFVKTWAKKRSKRK